MLPDKVKCVGSTIYPIKTIYDQTLYISGRWYYTQQFCLGTGTEVICSGNGKKIRFTCSKVINNNWSLGVNTQSIKSVVIKVTSQSDIDICGLRALKIYHYSTIANILDNQPAWCCRWCIGSKFSGEQVPEFGVAAIITHRPNTNP